MLGDEACGCGEFLPDVEWLNHFVPAAVLSETGGFVETVGLGATAGLGTTGGMLQRPSFVPSGE